MFLADLLRDVYTHLNNNGFIVPKIYEKIKYVDEQKLGKLLEKFKQKYFLVYQIYIF